MEMSDQQIKSLAELTGKCITKASTGGFDDQLTIAFSDGTFFYLCFGSDGLMMDAEPENMTLLRLGILTPEEVDRREQEARARQDYPL